MVCWVLSPSCQWMSLACVCGVVLSPSCQQLPWCAWCFHRAAIAGHPSIHLSFCISIHLSIHLSCVYIYIYIHYIYIYIYMYMAYDTNVYIHTCIHIAHVTAYTYAVICVAMSLCTHSATASPAPPLRHRLSVAVAAFFQAAMAGDTLTESAGHGSSVKAPSTPWPDLHPCFKNFQAAR